MPDQFDIDIAKGFNRDREVDSLRRRLRGRVVAGGSLSAAELQRFVGDSRSVAILPSEESLYIQIAALQRTMDRLYQTDPDSTAVLRYAEFIAKLQADLAAVRERNERNEAAEQARKAEQDKILRWLGGQGRLAFTAPDGWGDVVVDDPPPPPPEQPPPPRAPAYNPAEPKPRKYDLSGE